MGAYLVLGHVVLIKLVRVIRRQGNPGYLRHGVAHFGPVIPNGALGMPTRPLR